MKFPRFLLLVLPLFLVGALVIGLFPEDPPQPAQPAAGMRRTGKDDGSYALFPQISDSGVTSVSITTPSSSFELHRDGEHAVSVNGQRGDTDVFSTLLYQIADMSCVPTEPFSTQETPLLTLVVHQDGAQYAAQFYDDDATGEYARVVSKKEGVAQYAVTGGWRVGTLLLTCEGMRIQDESGREIPAE